MLEQRKACLHDPASTSSAPPIADWIQARMQQLHEILEAGGERANAALRNLVGGSIIIEEQTIPGRKRKYMLARFTMTTRALLAGLSAPTDSSNGELPSLKTEEVTVAIREELPWAAIADDVKKRFDAGLEYERIAEELQCTRSWVAKALAWWHTQHGLPAPDGRQHRGRLELLIRSFHVKAVVEYHRPGPCPSDEIILPGASLDDFEGRGDDVVTLETVGPDIVRARWNEGPVPQVRDYANPGKEKLPPIPDEARKLVPVERDLFKALKDASHCVARDSCRFSLAMIQLRGRKGEVIATDGKQLLLQKGFSFPWVDDVLIPTLGIFSSKDLDQKDSLFLGRRTRISVYVSVLGSFT